MRCSDFDIRIKPRIPDLYVSGFRIGTRRSIAFVACTILQWPPDTRKTENLVDILQTGRPSVNSLNAALYI